MRSGAVCGLWRVEWSPQSPDRAKLYSVKLADIRRPPAADIHSAMFGRDLDGENETCLEPSLQYGYSGPNTVLVISDRAA